MFAVGCSRFMFWILVMFLVINTASSEFLGSIPHIENGTEVHTWFTAPASVNDIKFDAVIPGNYLIATPSGLYTTDGATFTLVSSFPTATFVQVYDEIYLIPNSGSTHCIELFTRTGPTEGTSIQYGNCTDSGLEEGPLTDQPMLAYPADLMALNGGRQLLLNDRYNSRVRTIDAENKKINIGIRLNNFNYYITEHPHDPEMVYITIKHGVYSLNLTSETYSLVTGSTTSGVHGGYSDGNWTSALYSYPAAMTFLGEDMVIADTNNDRLRYLANFSASDNGQVKTICNGTGEADGNFSTCKINCRKGLLYDGIRLIFPSDGNLRYIGPSSAAYDGVPYHGNWRKFRRSQNNAACNGDLGMYPVVSGQKIENCMFACLRRKGCIGVHQRDTMCSLVTRIAQASGGPRLGECYLLQQE